MTIDRIVVINDISAPKGGATALALLSARQFRARGHAVTYLTGDAGDNAGLRALGVEIAALGHGRLLSRSTLGALSTGLYNRAASDHVAAWIAANDTPGTIYHVHGWSQILSPALFAALRPVIDRVVLSAHDFFLACPNGSFAFLRSGRVCPHVPMSVGCITARCDRRSYAQKLWRVGRQAILNQVYDRHHSPPILAIHETMRPFLMRAGIPGSAIETLPNPAAPWTRERIPVERNREVLFVGRLEETKGPDLAAAACRAAGVPLRLIGDGVLRAALERDYPEVMIMGHQPPDAIAQHARQARLLVMPSRYPEPYGLVAAEALGSGLPVIAADTAFLTADIEAAGAGLGVEPRDTRAFASAIRLIAEDDRRARRMSEAAVGLAGRIALSTDAWIDRLLLIYGHQLAAVRRSAEHPSDAAAPASRPSSVTVGGRR